MLHTYFNAFFKIFTVSDSDNKFISYTYAENSNFTFENIFLAKREKN